MALGRRNGEAAERSAGRVEVAVEPEREERDAFEVRRPDSRARVLDEGEEGFGAPREVRPRSIDVECVAHGCLMRVGFGAGVSPEEAVAYLRASDPAVQLRKEFPSKGNFGPKETKLARVYSINVRVTDSGKFVELSCSTPDDDFTVIVGRNSVENFLADVRALGKVGERALGKMQKAFDEKSSATARLDDAEQFGVKYWEKDGKRYSDGFVAAPPALEESKQ